MTHAGVKFVLSASFLFLGSVFGLNSAHAEEDRPFLQSQMNIVEAQPVMSNIQQAQLLMTRKDGAPSPTGFVLRLDRRFMTFDIAKIKRDACGTELYVGMASNGSEDHSYRLVVVDHSRETCKPAPSGDVHALPVGAALEVLLLDQSEPLLRMTGEPEPIVMPH
jgi:hypothetical protein